MKKLSTPCKTGIPATAEQLLHLPFQPESFQMPKYRRRPEEGSQLEDDANPSTPGKKIGTSLDESYLKKSRNYLFMI